MGPGTVDYQVVGLLHDRFLANAKALLPGIISEYQVQYTIRTVAAVRYLVSYW